MKSSPTPSITPVRRLRHGVIGALVLAAGTTAVHAQLGDGWTEYFPRKTIQQVNGTNVARYSNVDGVETFEIVPGSNRCEARVQNDYTSGMHQFEGEVRVWSPTDSQSIHQKFPNVLIRAWDANGGEIRMQSGTVMITGCYGTWVRMNTIHDVSAGWVDVYINGVKKGGRTHGEGTTHYHKYGVYGTLHTASAKSEWRNVRFFRNGSHPVAAPPPTPTGLTVAAGNTQAILSWNMASAASGYNVKRSTSSGGPYTTVASPVSTAYTNTGLVNGTTYYYVVSATNSLGESTNSLPVSVTPFNPGFSMSVAPASHVVSAGNSTNCTVTVTTNSLFSGSVAFGITGLPAGASAGFNPPTLALTGTSTLTIQTTTNMPGGNHTLTIRGTNGANVLTATATLTLNAVIANPGTLLWTGAGGTNWSVSASWTNSTAGGGGPPGASNNLLFTNTATAGSPSTINNVVNGDFTIRAVRYSHTSGFHTTRIADGASVTITNILGTNAVFVGTGVDSGSNQTVTVAITGASGTLNLQAPGENLNVRQGGSAGTHQAVLNLSGLGTLNATVGRVLIAGDGGSANTDARLSGVLYLARTNTIIATGGAPAISIGDHPSNGRGNPPITLLPSFLFLGQSNAIFTDSITVGRQKAAPVSLLFNPAFIAGNPSALFRGAGGVNSRVGLWAVGDNLPLGSSNQATEGTNDFSGGTVDALVDVMRLGTSCNGNNVGSGTGLVNVASGIIDVNTLQLGHQTVSSGAVGSGTFNVGDDALLIVNTELVMARYAGGAGGAVGTLNINGGSAELRTVTSAGGNSTVNVNGGALTLDTIMGTSAAPVTSLRLTNATLHLNVEALSGSTNIVVGVLSAGGLNGIAIHAEMESGQHLTLPLIAYSTFEGSVPSHFYVLEVPAGYTGSLTNNQTNKTIELILTALPQDPPTISGITAAGTDLIITGDGGVADAFYHVLASTNLGLPLSQWTVLSTNVFGVDGNFAFTNSFGPNQPQEYFRIRLP